jgi:hypothetical protein
VKEQELIRDKIEIFFVAKNNTDQQNIEKYFQFKIENSSVLLTGRIPESAVEEKNGLRQAVFSLVFVMKEKVFGYKSSSMMVVLDVRGTVAITAKEYFLIFVIVTVICLLMCLIALLAGKSTNNEQKKAVADAISKPITDNAMLTHSVLEWKKEDNEQKPVDVTMVDELFMFREADQKKNRKKRIYEMEDDFRPEELNLAQLDRKLALERTTSFIGANSEPNSSLKRPNGINENMDLSPIRIPKGENFKVRSPSYMPDPTSRMIREHNEKEENGNEDLGVDKYDINLDSPNDKEMMSEYGSERNQPVSAVSLEMTPIRDFHIQAFSSEQIDSPD